MGIAGAKAPMLVFLVPLPERRRSGVSPFSDLALERVIE